MNSIRYRWEIIGILITIIVGTLLHFVYAWTGKSELAAVFGAVNESTWEHLKLLFWPFLLFSIAEYFAYGREYDNFIFSKAIGILIGVLTIIVLFYSYTGILGKDIFWLDILIFIISVVVSFLVSSSLLSSGYGSGPIPRLIGSCILILMTFGFIFFTFYPPKIPLFQDPITGTYGIHAVY